MLKINQLRDLIKQKPALIWYTKNYDSLSKESIVEAVLNYGSWDDFKKTESILGVKELASVFNELKSHKRSNLHYLANNYFSLYFDKYV